MSKIEFKVVKSTNTGLFEQEVEELLNNGFGIEKIMIDRNGSWTYYYAFMMKGI